MAMVKSKVLLPVIFIVVFALSRIPGLMPPNFSVAYALAFCAGAFLGGSMAWWLPLGAILVTDVALNVFKYHTAPLGFSMVPSYAVYALLIALGRWFGAKAGMLKLVLGGLLGAVIFYLVTNTFSWLADPGYAKTVAGWIQALTTGLPTWHPTTWEMFRNTLMSGGLFTALFAGAAKLTAESPADKKAGAREPKADKEPESDPEAEPEDAKA
jgi:hypothetical protein